MQCGILCAADMRIQSIYGWKITGIREARHKSIPDGVHRQIQRAVVPSAAQICEINEIGRGVAEFCNESITINGAPSEIWLESSSRYRKRELCRKRFPGHINETVRSFVHLYSQSDITCVSSKIGRVAQYRVNDQWQFGIVLP